MRYEIEGIAKMFETEFEYLLRLFFPDYFFHTDIAN